jgi:hypothetical protein
MESGMKSLSQSSTNPVKTKFAMNQFRKAVFLSLVLGLTFLAGQGFAHPDHQDNPLSRYFPVPSPTMPQAPGQ